MDLSSISEELFKLYPKKSLQRVAISPALEDRKERYAKYRNNPLGYVREVLKITPTPMQELAYAALPGRVKINSGHNIGKGQPACLRIDTPDGCRRFGDLRIGDRVFGRDGQPTDVTGVFRRGVLTTYRVTFDDGSYTLVDGDHLWYVRGRSGRRAMKGKDHGWETLSTTEILQRGVKRANGKTEARQWEVPRIEPVNYAHQETLIPPYTLGLWLGDGSTASGRITSADPEMPEWIAADTKSEVKVYPEKSRASSIFVVGLRTKLRLLGLLNTPTRKKRVPRSYMENSVAVRLAVLQGLMDTDGFVGKKGAAEFCSTSRGLVEDVVWLVRSLGGKAHFRSLVKKPYYCDDEGKKIYGQDAYSATLRLPEFPLFRLSRKQERITYSTKPKYATRFLSRWIDSIEEIGVSEIVCIRVAAADSLYLTNDFIPTHNTHWCATILSWWYDTRDPCIILTTAPTERDVVDLLWTEVRLQRQHAGLDTPYAGPRAPVIFDHDEHWAKGFTARKGENFVGRHRPSMLFLFDECEMIDAIYWTTTNTMYQADPLLDNCWVAIGNPLTTASQSYLEDMAIDLKGEPKWKTFSFSSLDHPNILAGLKGEPAPFPNAVSLSQVEDWIADWCDRLEEDEITMTGDFQWPPESGIWYRPGPQFKSRALGVRPTEGVDTVWGSHAWECAITSKITPHECWRRHFGITIGTDPADMGSDQTAIHVRTGPLSLHHEEHNGWNVGQTADRIKKLATEWAGWYNRLASVDRPKYHPAHVKVLIEMDGVGSGVMSHCNGFGNWVGFKMSEKSEMLNNMGKPIYYNKRSEVWFEPVKKAKGGMIDLSRLKKDVLAKLRQQLLAPSYKVDLHSGLLLVEPKDEVKKRLKRSPDTADAFLASHCETASYTPQVVGLDRDDEDNERLADREERKRWTFDHIFSSK